MKKRNWIDLSIIFAFLLLGGIFFGRLFYPKPGIIATPDFGTNDAIFRSLATKYVYGNALRNHVFPLWTTLIGGGYPVTAEAIGGLFPLNLLVFSLTDPVTAYNLTLAISVIFFGIGVYWWMRVLGIGRIAAVYAGATLMLSGIIIPRLTHGMIIPALSLLPWIMGTTSLYAQNGRTKTGIFLSLLIAYQILTNFPQASMLTLGFAFLFYVFAIWNTPSRWHHLGLFALWILLAIGVSGIQLVPTWEYLQQSLRSSGFDPEGAVQYSFYPKNFLTFLSPFILGSPANGSYPPYWQFMGSIFWENSGYVGIVPLVGTVFGIVFLRWKQWKGQEKPLFLFFLMATVLGCIFMAGKYSPLYIAFTLPPLSLFRTPSRFLWIVVPSLVAMSALLLDTLLSRYSRNLLVRFSVIALVVLNTVLLFSSWYSYHLVIEKDVWMKRPEILSAIDGRIYSIGIPALHNKEFTKRGWTRPDEFLFLRNGLQPNENVFWDVPSLDVYGAVPLSRSSTFTSYLSENILGDRTGVATVSAMASHILSMSSVDTILTPYSLVGDSLEKRGEVVYGEEKLYAYHNTSTLPRVRMAYQSIEVHTFEDAFRQLATADFDPKKKVLVEQSLPAFATPSAIPVIDTKESDNGTLTITVRDNPTEGILVVADTYYPGWIAVVDGKTESILPVNIANRGVLLPRGSHTVLMSYKPKSFLLGGVISLISGLFLISGWVFLPDVSSPNTRARGSQHRSRRANNHAK